MSKLRESRNPMQALIISFDSLAANAIGCYGNEWIETPHWDRLAADGAVFDLHFAETVGLQSGMAWALGTHWRSELESRDSDVLAALLKSQAVAARMIVTGEIQPWQRVIPFDEIRSVQGNEGLDAAPQETPFANLVKAGIETWNDSVFQRQSRLLWLHASGPGIPPIGFESLYFEDFQERGQEIAELDEETRSQHPAVYAGAVSLLDHWIGELVANLEASLAGEPTLVIVMAANGHLWQQIKTGRPGTLQSPSSPLCDQLARTPLVLKIYHDQRFEHVVSLRSDRLVQTTDLVPTLIDWFAPQASPFVPPPRSWLRELTEEIPARSSLQYGDGAGTEAVRTRRWLCIRENGDTPTMENEQPTRGSANALYVKPEDLWDVDNVASQHPEVVAELLQQVPENEPQRPGADS